MNLSDFITYAVAEVNTLLWHREGWVSGVISAPGLGLALPSTPYSLAPGSTAGHQPSPGSKQAPAAEEQAA